jgi:hypothetical protein
VLAIVGLAHLGRESGKILRIGKGSAGRQPVEVLADLGAACLTFAMESPRSLIVMTTQRLMRVRTSGSVKPLLPVPWHYVSLRPNSVSISPSGVIHIGLQHFVIRLMPTEHGYTEEWLVPLECLQFEFRDENCVCIPGRKP